MMEGIDVSLIEDDVMQLGVPELYCVHICILIYKQKSILVATSF